MNTPFSRWLLNINDLPVDDSTAQLAWAHNWPAWVWLLIIVAIALFTFWMYSRVSGVRLGRGILAAVRGAALLLVLILIAGPMIQIPREFIQKDWVIFLLDRSVSMEINDNKLIQGVQTRDQQLKDIVLENTEVFDSLGKEKDLVWLGFGQSTYIVDGLVQQQDGEYQLEIPPAQDTKTQIATSIKGALERAAARPISGIVLLSDGQTDDPPDANLIRQLVSDAVPIFSIPLGSTGVVGDLSISNVVAPTQAFIRDRIPIEVEVEWSADGATAPRRIIRLIDERTGDELDTAELPVGSTETKVTLIADATLSGEATWTVVAETEEADVAIENNSQSLSINLIDRPLRVLYIEGYPRWEYRYLKNLLVREESIRSAIMLVSADQDFAQEGNEPISRLPRTAEELRKYDVVILGDIPAGFLSPHQIELITDHVLENGAGLLWIAGERSVPYSFGSTALTDLLPMTSGPRLERLNEPVNMVSTQVAQAMGVLNLTTDDNKESWPKELTSSDHPWAQIYYAQAIDPHRLKVGAEVLAESSQEIMGSKMPLVIQLRYGAGKSVYVATDEIWRWRFGRGESLVEQFWIQLIRNLGQTNTGDPLQPASLNVEPRRLAPSQPMRIELSVQTKSIADELGESVVVELIRDGEVVGTLSLEREDTTQYGATYLPSNPGVIEVRPRSSMLDSLDLRQIVEVENRQNELANPQTDHDLLKQISLQTGGQIVSPQELDELGTLLPNRSVSTLNPLLEPIWDSPLAFILMVLLLTGEWVGRRIIGLV